MFQQISPLIKNHLKSLLFAIYNNTFSRSIYLNEINRRTFIPYTDIKSLAKNINIFSPHTYEVHRSNDYYSHATVLKKFLGLPRSHQFKFNIEHGISLGYQTVELEINSPFKTILVSSKPRKKLWEKMGYKAFSIGPYIHYAKGLMSKKQLQSERERLGKNMLVFPAHSTPDLSTKYDVGKYCRLIQKIGKSFDSVRICLYWQDILNGIDKYYQNLGFECVTAGHVLDFNFLRRLKSIIEASDVTISNDVGTFSGYCIHLNKPHSVLYGPIKLKGKKNEIAIVTKERQSIIFREVLSVLNEYREYITNEQKSVIGKYWGFNQIKNKEQLKKIIKKINYNYRLN